VSLNDLIGQLLPLAVGVAISPLPIVAVILVLLSPKAKSSGLGFLAGWVLGIIAVVGVFTLVGGVIPAGDAGTQHPLVGIVKIVIGALLLAVGVRIWVRRPRDRDVPATPRWMGLVATMTLPKGVVFGFVLSVFNPVNLLLSITAGIDIGSSLLLPGDEWIAIAIFTVIGAATVALPVVGYVIAGTRATPLLNTLRVWLIKHNAVLTCTMLLVIGVDLVGKGIGTL
jgi:hypothetical protein